MALTVIAAYDVSNDDRRARVAALLQVWGDRIQYSVFLLTLTEEDLTELLARVRATINPNQDSFYVFRQCLNCWESHHAVGQADVRRDALYWAVM